MTTRMGISGRIAAYFQASQLTPLLAALALLLGVFAVAVTPREEEPQIDVTMANVIVPYPGASVADVTEQVSTPAEHVLSQMVGLEHVTSVSRPGVAVLTVQFKVGVPRTEALVRLHDTLRDNADWIPPNMGVLQPLIKPKGIDDVPIVNLTLHTQNPKISADDLERVAHSIELEIKRVPGTREVQTLGGPGHAIMVRMDPNKLSAHGLEISDLRAAIQSANQGQSVGELIKANQAVPIEAGPFLATAADVEDLMVSVQNGRPVFLKDVAQIEEGPLPIAHSAWFNDQPAVTLTVTKKAGENAIDVANAVISRAEHLKNTLIPEDVEMTVTRNYGTTANDKAVKLIQKLLFATASVVALVFLALGRREAAIVGVAVVLTLSATLFASWAWGFTLNRVSLFALIFSIGILVDDAIVVVENIHRHQQKEPNQTLLQLIPGAVNEVGGPTILATLTVIAALLPMAFVSGLMGPYMGPIPINASLGMLLSLAIAFVITPWLARIWMKPSVSTAHAKSGLSARLAPMFQKWFTPLLDDVQGSRNRKRLAWGIAALIVFSVALPVLGWVQLKMLPFDNKSEFQVMVDMPVGTPLEKTKAVMQELAHYLATVPEVTDTQSYVGTSGPINFNGLVRQYYLRSGGHVGDIQVNLVDKHHRHEQSHGIATRLRPELQKMGSAWGANVKVVEVPPGPPVLSPLVAEIYGPDADGRKQVAQQVREIFSQTPSVVDVDDSGIAKAERQLVRVDRRKAAEAGVSVAAVATTLRAGLSGESVSVLHNQSKYSTPVVLEPPDALHGHLDDLLKLKVRGNNRLVPLSELVQITSAEQEQPIVHKDLLPVHLVTGDMAGQVDSPLYGLFNMRSRLQKLKSPLDAPLAEYFIHQPDDAYQGYAIKWDGEWQITYETFRDMGTAYAVGLILIYLLVVAQFGSYLTPLIIMAPIPLTIIGVMPGHALLGAQYTATSMIGMIALAGIIVRNSILLVDFINLEVRSGVPFKQAIVKSAYTRAQPIILTGLAAMLGAFFILDDPIFNGLAISLIFGISVSTALTLIVIPTLYFAAYRNRLHKLTPSK
jgi:multidrug efflux pump subunit AcrB